ncbi:TcdA/TcdB catalytic glycosyltransferase domain-containing protein [Endozoicomonadaceae bacterium StTr2]
MYAIPKYLHWIWLGGKLPRHHLNNMLKIMAANPDYQIFLWCNNAGVYSDFTDLSDKLAISGASGRTHIHRISEVEAFRIRNRQGENLMPWLAGIVARESQGVFPNFASASDILRFLILYLVGGVYLDVDIRLHSPLGELQAAMGTLLGPAYFDEGQFTSFGVGAVASAPGARPCLCYLLDVLRTYRVRDRRIHFSAWNYDHHGSEYEVIEMMPAETSWLQKRIPSGNLGSLREEATFSYTGVAGEVFGRLAGYPHAYFFPVNLIADSPAEGAWSKHTGVMRKAVESPI